MSSPKEKANKLMAELKQIESQILDFEAVLKSNNIGMDDPLTDENDFPKLDIDHYAVRNARGQIRCLLNDRKAKMDEIDHILAEIHQSAPRGNGGETKPQNNDEVTVHRTSNDPFVQVDKVVPDSPASQAGLSDGDLVIQFGPLHADIFNKLDQLKEVVTASVNKPIRLTVLRGIRVHHFQLVPKQWAGSGLLGCSFTTVERKKKH